MGRGGESNVVEDSSTPSYIQPCEVLIDGELYDLKYFKHPGGKIIEFYQGNGTDATQAYNNFHFRSNKAKKLLSHLPHRKADQEKISKLYLPGQQELLNDFNKLQKELEDEGYFKPSIPHVIFRILEIVIFYIFTFYNIFNGRILLGCFFGGITCGRCGWFMHEAGHYSLTGNIWMDRLLQNTSIGLSCSLSSSYWRSQHNKHHAMPQRLEHDTDLNTLPLVAFSKKVVTPKMIKLIGPGLKWFLSTQVVTYPLFTAFAAIFFIWRLFLHPRHMIRSRNYSEAAACILHYAPWVMIMIPHFGFKQTIFMYTLQAWVASNYMFVNFTISHSHLDTVDANDNKVNYSHMIEYDRNLELNYT
jgi:fatty acid desaturase